MEDIQSWWEIPSIAHFCSLFRTSFDLLDFDIEELEEALLTDSAEDVGSSLLQDLIVRLLKGCSEFDKDDITSFNFQMYLRRLFRAKCEEDPSRPNPFNRDEPFHSLPLRTKVEIIFFLCDFRLDSHDVPDHLKTIEADSLRVSPLGKDSGGSTYWYFYGTRLYREDYNKHPSKRSKKAAKEREEYFDFGGYLHTDSKWQVVCYSEEDWQLLAQKFKNCKNKHEASLDRTLREDFLPVLPRLFAEKEKLMRKRMMDQQLRRSNRSILGRPNDDGSESPSASVAASGEPETDDEIKRRRLLQEKADRLLAEAMQKEERKAGLQLRERRGGAATVASSSRPSTSASASTSIAATNGPSSIKSNDNSTTNSNSKSKSSSNRNTKRKSGGQKKEQKKARMTNNSLSACLPFVLDVNSKSDDDDDDEGDEDKSRSDGEVDEAAMEISLGGSDSETNSEEEEDDDDDDDDTFRPSSSKGKSPAKKKKKKDKGIKDKDKDKRSHRKGKSGSGSSSSKKRSEKSKSKSKERHGSGSGSTKNKKSREVILPIEIPIPTTSSSSGVSKTKVKSSVLFSQSEEDVNIGMHKVMEAIKNHRDAWPFASAVEENYAPNYYKVILFPMNLDTMEDKLDNHEYTSLEQFKADFASIVANCVKYNGPTNEYTEMVERLNIAFHKAIDRYIIPDESDEEMFNIEYNEENERRKPRLNSSTSSLSKSKTPKTPKEIIEKRKEVVKSLSESVAKSKSMSSHSHSHGHGHDKGSTSSTSKSRKDQLMGHHPRIDGLNSATGDTLKDIDKWLGQSPHLGANKGATEGGSSSGCWSTASSDSEVLPSRAPTAAPDPPAAAAASAKSKKTSGKSSSKSRSRSNNSKSRSHDSKSRHKEKRKRSESQEKGKEKKVNKKDPSYSSYTKAGDSSKPVKKRARPEEFDDDDEEVTATATTTTTKHHHKRHRHEEPEPSPKEKEKEGEHSKKKEKEHKSGHHSNNNSGNSSKKDKRRPSTPQTPPYKGKTANESKPNAAALKNKKFSALLMGFNKRMQQSSHKVTPGSSSGQDGSLKSDLFGGNSKNSSASDQASTSSSMSSGTIREEKEKKKCLLVNETPSDGRLSLGTVLPKEAVRLELEVEGDEDEEGTSSSVAASSSNANANNNCTDATVDEMDLLDKLEQRFGPEIKEKARALISEGAAAAKAKAQGQSSSTTTPKVELTEEERIEVEAASQEEADRKFEPSKGFNRDKSLPNLAAWFKAFGCPTGSGGAAGGGSAPGASPGGGGPATATATSSPLKRFDDPKSRFKVMGRGIGEDANSGNSPRKFPRGLKSLEPQTSNWSQRQKDGTNNSPTTSTPPQSGGGAAIEDIAMELQQKRNRNRKMSTSSISSQSELGSPSFPAAQDGGVVVIPPRWVDTTTEHWGSQSQSPSSQVSSQSPAGPNSPFSPPGVTSPPPPTPPRALGPVRVGFYQDMSASQNSSSPEKGNEGHSPAATPPSLNNLNPGTPNPPTPRRETSVLVQGGAKNYSTGGGYHPPAYAPRYGGSSSTPSPSPHAMASPSPGGPLSVGSPSNSQSDGGSPHSPSMAAHKSPSGGGGLNLADYRNPSPGFNMRPSMASTPEALVRAHGGRGSTPSILSISSYPSPSGGGPATLPPPYPGSYVNVLEGRQMDGVVSNPIYAHGQHSHHPHGHGLSPHPEAAHAHAHAAHAHAAHTHHLQQGRYGLPGSAPAAHANSVPQAAHQHQSSPVSGAGGIVYGGRGPIPPPTSSSSQAQPPSAYHSNPYTSNPRNINVAPSVYNNPAERFYGKGSAETLLGMLPLSSGAAAPTTVTPVARGRNKGHAHAHAHTHAHAQEHNDSDRDSHSGSSSGHSHSHSHGSHGHRHSPMQGVPSSSSPSGSKVSGGNDLPPSSAMNGFQWPHNLASLTQIVNNIPNPMAVGVNPYLNRGHSYSVDPATSAAVEKYQRSGGSGSSGEPPAYTMLNSGNSKGNGGHVTTAHNENIHLVKTITGGYGAAETGNEGGNGGSSASSSSAGSSGRRTKGEGKSRQKGSASASAAAASASASAQQLMTAGSFSFSGLPSDLALYSKEIDPSSLYSAAAASSHSHRELYPTSTSSFHSSFAAAARTTTGSGSSPIAPYNMPPFIGSHPSPYQPQPVSSQPSPFSHSQSPRAIVDSYQQFFQPSPQLMASLLPPGGYPPGFNPHHITFPRPGWI